MRILASALVEFGEKGRGGARMQSVADRAGCTKALVHYYFRSKDRLYESVFDYFFMTHAVRVMEALSSGKPFPELLRDFVDVYVDILDQNPMLPVFVLRDLSEETPTMPARLLRMARPDRNIPMAYMRSFRASVERGDIVAADPMQTLMTMFGACLYYFVARPLFETIHPSMAQRRDSFVESRRQHIYDILYYGLKPRTEQQQ
jgi:TetR/AcrR family transcriptional regulator